MSAAAWGPAPGTPAAAAPAASAGTRTGDLHAAGGSGRQPSMGAVVLVTTRGGGGQVLAVHLPQGSPSLVAQLLPLDLPQLTSAGDEVGGSGGGGGETSKSAGGGKSGGGGSAGGGDSARALDIVSMSWDPSGKRLAAVLDSAAGAKAGAGVGAGPRGSHSGLPGAKGGGHVEETGPHRPGRVVLYSVRISPVVSASLLGYVSPRDEADEGVGGGSQSARASHLTHADSRPRVKARLNFFFSILFFFSLSNTSPPPVTEYLYS